MEKRLSELKEQVAWLAEGHQPEVDMCWLEHVALNETTETNYCPDCGEAMFAWLMGGEKPSQLDLGKNHEGHPVHWHGRCAEGEVHLLRDGGQETETPKHCDLCGKRLSVVLLEEGARCEVEHFGGMLEEFRSGVRPYSMSPDEWFDVLEMIGAIEYVEEDWFPGQWMRPYAAEDRRKTYGRVLATVQGLLDLATAVRGE